jgi:hypothetical protein
MIQSFPYFISSFCNFNEGFLICSCYHYNKTAAYFLRHTVQNKMPVDIDSDCMIIIKFYFLMKIYYSKQLIYAILYKSVDSQRSSARIHFPAELLYVSIISCDFSKSLLSTYAYSFCFVFTNHFLFSFHKCFGSYQLRIHLAI